MTKTQYARPYHYTATGVMQYGRKYALCNWIGYDKERAVMCLCSEDITDELFATRADAVAWLDAHPDYPKPYGAHWKREYCLECGHEFVRVNGLEVMCWDCHFAKGGGAIL